VILQEPDLTLVLEGLDVVRFLKPIVPKTEMCSKMPFITLSPQSGFASVTEENGKQVRFVSPLQPVVIGLFPN
jgi:hypothetical protein